MKTINKAPDELLVKIPTSLTAQPKKRNKPNRRLSWYERLIKRLTRGKK